MRLHNITNPNGNWIQIWTAGGLPHNLHETLNCASVCMSEESSGLFAIPVQLPLEINFLKQKQNRSIVNTYHHHCSGNEKAPSSPVQKYWRLGKFKRNISRRWPKYIWTQVRFHYRFFAYWGFRLTRAKLLKVIYRALQHWFIMNTKNNLSWGFLFKIHFGKCRTY